MSTTGPISFRAAQAYGLRPDANNRSNAGGRESSAARGSQIVPPYSAVASESASTSAAKASANVRADHLSISLAKLVPNLKPGLIAGAVDSAVGRGSGFDEASANSSLSSRTSSAQAGAFAMYTRAADRVEVATSVMLGASIDARG
jgi:hypothetical protein